jgi:arylsulfatase
MIADRDYRIECAFSYADGDEGVVFALGDPIAGMALYVRDRRLAFVYHGGEGRPVVCDALPLREGDNRFVLDHRALGKRQGRGLLSINGEAAGTLDMSPSTILGLGVGEGLDVGCDRKLHVTPLYGRDDSFRYTGSVAHVRIEPGAQARDGYANRREREAQRD